MLHYALKIRLFIYNTSLIIPVYPFSSTLASDTLFSFGVNRSIKVQISIYDFYSKHIYIVSTVVIFLENESDLAIRVVNVLDDFRVEKVLGMQFFNVFLVFGGLLLGLVFIVV